MQYGDFQPDDARFVVLDLGLRVRSLDGMRREMAVSECVFVIMPGGFMHVLRRKRRREQEIWAGDSESRGAGHAANHALNY